MKPLLVNSLLALGIVTSLAFGATFALFQDGEDSEGNTVDAGKLDVTLTPRATGNNRWVFPIENMKPGDVTNVMHLNLKDLSAPPSGHTEVRITAHGFVDSSVESGGANSAEDFLKQLKVERLVFRDGGPERSLLDCVSTDHDGNADFKSVFDVIEHGVFDYDDRATCTDLGALILHGDGSLRIRLEMPQDLPDADDNRYQGDTILLDFEFGFAQQDGQDVLV